MTAPFTEFEVVGRALEAHPWVFAKTMPENPHEYTLRKRWDDGEFVRAVSCIRAQGYPALFKGRRYTQLNVNEHFYWTMGAPLPATILINRKVNQPPAVYDPAAPQYDDVFSDASSRRENEALFDLIGDVSGDSVLDIGCATGMFLDHTCPRSYTGIDPSSAMISRIKAKHARRPNTRFINTPLQSFVGERYDLVVALFGVASYLTQEERNRIPSLLNPGGRAVLMFYRPGYVPKTHEVFDLTPFFTPLAQDAPGARPFGQYALVEQAQLERAA